jgi:hypothetical protein
MDQIRGGRVLVTYWLEELPGLRGLFALARHELLLSCLLAEAGRIPTSCDELEDYEKEHVAVLLDCVDPGIIDIPGSCQRVVGLDFQYFDDAAGEWREDWNSEEENSLRRGRLPAAVQITLFLEDERGLIHDFSTMVDLPLARGQPTPHPGDPEDEEEDEEEDEDDDFDDEDDE